MEGNSGVIQSPGYNKVPYPNMVKCTWTIKSSAPIHLTFKDTFNLVNGDSLMVSCRFEIQVYILQSCSKVVSVFTFIVTLQLAFCVVMTKTNQLHGSFCR